MSLTALQKVKYLVLKTYSQWAKKDLANYESLTGEEIDSLYEEIKDTGNAYDARNEVRCGSFETEVEAPYDRHYEAKSVAEELPDGSYVGWTYWYGGGKHSEPSAIDWMSEAYDLECEKKEITIIKHTFTKK